MADGRPVGKAGGQVLRLAAKAMLYSLLLLLVAHGVFWSLPHGEFLLDFGSFVAAGRAAAEGLNPYGVYPLTFRLDFERIGPVETPNLNPPISVPVFAALSRLDPVIAFRAWYAMALGLYLLVLVMLVRAYPEYARPLRLGWALSLAGLWHTLQLGQVYVPLLAAAAAACVALERGRHVWAGLLIGLLVAVKPNLTIWLLLLWLVGCWRVSLVGATVAGLVSALPLVAYGPGIYRLWLAAVRGFSGALLPGNSSLPGLAARLGVPWLGSVLAVALVLGLAGLTRRRRPPVGTVSALAIVASLLVSPITWVGYTILLLPVLFRRAWTVPLRLAAVILAVPFEVILQCFQLSQWHFVLFGSFYSLALLLVLGAMVEEGVDGLHRSRCSGRDCPDRIRRLLRGGLGLVVPVQAVEEGGRQDTREAGASLC